MIRLLPFMSRVLRTDGLHIDVTRTVHHRQRQAAVSHLVVGTTAGQVDSELDGDGHDLSVLVPLTNE